MITTFLKNVFSIKSVLLKEVCCDKERGREGGRKGDREGAHF